jgi:hypothetical protein
VTPGSVPRVTTTTAEAADLVRTDIAEDKLCRLGKGNFGGLGRGANKAFSVSISGHP